MTYPLSGWGTGWGSFDWGGSTSPELGLMQVLALRENVVRLWFNHPPYFSGIWDLNDASELARYGIVANPTTIGLDGEVARAVNPIGVELVPGLNAGGKILDLTVDRPFTHYPAEYRVTVNNLRAADTGLPLDPAGSSAIFYGLRRQYKPPSPELEVPRRDMANPSTQSAMLDPLPNPNDPLNLGVFVVDDSGDYAFDEGLVNLKKRIFRRLLTRKGGFAHLPTYGVGVADDLKRLGTAAVRERLSTEAEAQIALEPDVLRVKVDLVSDLTQPNLTRMIVKVRTREGLGVKWDLPVPTGI